MCQTDCIGHVTIFYQFHNCQDNETLLLPFFSVDGYLLLTVLTGMNCFCCSLNQQTTSTAVNLSRVEILVSKLLRNVVVKRLIIYTLYSKPLPNYSTCMGYKPEGRGFDFRWCRSNFLVT